MFRTIHHLKHIQSSSISYKIIYNKLYLHFKHLAGDIMQMQLTITTGHHFEPMKVKDLAQGLKRGILVAVGLEPSAFCLLAQYLKH